MLYYRESTLSLKSDVSSRLNNLSERLTTSGIVQVHLVLLQRGEVFAGFADIERHCE